LHNAVLDSKRMWNMMLDLETLFILTYAPKVLNRTSIASLIKLSTLQYFCTWSEKTFL